MSIVFRLRWVAIAFIAIAQFGFISAIGTNPVSAQDSFTAAVAPNRFIVMLKPQTGISSAATATAYDNKPGVTVDHVYTSAISGFAGEFSNAALTELRNDPKVASVTPDYLIHASAETVPAGIDRSDADLNPTKAGNGSGSVSVDVAVLDSGVYKHADLNVVGGKDCISGGSPYDDYNGHGTHVAGSIAAEDQGSGLVGIAPGARIWAVKVLDNNGNGTGSSLICGVDYVASKSSTIEVINMSLGGPSGPLGDACSADAIHQSICNVVNKGVTVVVAAGNDASDAKDYFPAQYNEVITVSAYYDSDGEPGGDGPDEWSGNFDDEFASFSNYGADVDISAPGVGVLSTASPLAFYTYCEGTDYCYESGTSMASPHVAGAAALILAQQGDMSPSSVRNRLRLTGQPGPIVGDPDGIDEPLMNVAFLGKGKIVAPTSVKVGDTIQVRVGDYTPDTRALFRFNGVFIGGDTIDDAGRGHRNYTIPAMAAGTYKATVSNGLKDVTKNVKVVSSLVISPTSGEVDDSVTVTLRGFAKSEVVTIKVGTKTIGTKTMSGTGSGSVSFDIPAMPRGTYTVRGTGNKGNSATDTIAVKQSAYVSGGTIEPNRNITVSYRGFKAGEAIVVRFDTQSGAVVNGSADVASSTGSGSDTVKIPASTTPGNHYLWLIGDEGTKIRVTINVVGASEDPPVPSPTATAEPTEEPTEAPTDVPTDEPTEVPTDVPTEEPTEAPTDVPTEEPTEVPTDEPTVEAPTETPVVEVPTEAPVEVIPTETAVP